MYFVNAIYLLLKKYKFIVISIYSINTFIGGTGLYIKSALFDYTIDDKVINNDYSEINTDRLFRI